LGAFRQEDRGAKCRSVAADRSDPGDPRSHRFVGANDEDFEPPRTLRNLPTRSPLRATHMGHNRQAPTI
jgi:hypothetical protein